MNKLAASYFVPESFHVVFVSLKLNIVRPYLDRYLYLKRFYFTFSFLFALFQRKPPNRNLSFSVIAKEIKIHNKPLGGFFVIEF